LAVYERPYDPQRPVVCFDEKPTEVQGDAVAPLPAAPQTPGAEVVRQDSTYTRGGLANLLLFSEALRGWRRIAVTADRTAATFADQIKQLVDEDYPDVEVIVLVLDNLNTHGPWSLYARFGAAEGARLNAKLEWHYTPEHGSWLNMAELELSVISGQCLKRRMGDRATLRREVEAWVRARNARQRKIHWQFTRANARIKLRRLYPVII